jgi:hypothetical protein
VCELARRGQLTQQQQRLILIVAAESTQIACMDRIPGAQLLARRADGRYKAGRK